MRTRQTEPETNVLLLELVDLSNFNLIESFQPQSCDTTLALMSTAKDSEIHDFLESLESLKVKPAASEPERGATEGRGRKSAAAQKALAFLDEITQPVEAGSKSLDHVRLSNRQNPDSKGGATEGQSPRLAASSSLSRENVVRPAFNSTEARQSFQRPGELGGSVESNGASVTDGTRTTAPADTASGSWSSWGSSWLSATQEKLSKATLLKAEDLKVSAEKLKQQVMHTVDAAGIEKLRTDLLEKTHHVAANLIETVAPTAAAVQGKATRRVLLHLWLCTSMDAAGDKPETALAEAVEEVAESVWISSEANDGRQLTPVACRVIVNSVDARAVASIEQIYDKVAGIVRAQTKEEEEQTKDYDAVENVILVCKQVPSSIPQQYHYITELFYPDFLAAVSRACVESTNKPEMDSKLLAVLGGGGKDLRLQLLSQSFSLKYTALRRSLNLHQYSLSQAGNSAMCAIEDLIQECRLIWDTLTAVE